MRTQIDLAYRYCTCPECGGESVVEQLPQTTFGLTRSARLLVLTVAGMPVAVAACWSLVAIFGLPTWLVYAAIIIVAAALVGGSAAAFLAGLEFGRGEVRGTRIWLAVLGLLGGLAVNAALFMLGLAMFLSTR